MELTFNNTQEELAVFNEKVEFFKKLSERVKRFEDSIKKHSNDHEIPVECKIIFKLTSDKKGE